MREEWQDVDGFEEFYAISNLGRIFSKRSNRCLIPHAVAGGYMQIGLCGYYGREKKYVHVLVAEAFLGRVDGLEVNHIDCDPSNNELSNLEWLTHSDNIRYSYLMGRRADGGRAPIRVRIIETGDEYESIQHCADAIGSNKSNIRKQLDGKAKTVKGRTFELV